MSEGESLTRQASRGAAWSLASNVAVSAISFIGTAILARMLTPKDFGLMGMAALVTSIVSLFGNFGLGAALVQKKDATEEDFSTAFWANCATGAALMFICVIGSPLASLFFHEKNVQWILILLSFNFMLAALCSVHSTRILKRVHMKPMALIEVGGRIFRVGIMLVAAFCGMSFWSIVIGMIVERLFKTVAFIILDPWRPGYIFSMQKFREMFRFGRNILGGEFLAYLNVNMDFIVTGRVLGADLLGFYQMAYNLPHLLKDYVSGSIGTVAFPVFCKVQDDNDRLVKGYLKIVKFIALATFPVLAGLVFTAHDFIFVAYGERWLPAVVPLQILCFCAAFASVNSIVGFLLYAKGRPDLGFKWECVRLPATIIAILIGVHFGGIVGVAWGMLVIEFFSIVMVWLIFRILNNSFSRYWSAILPATVACGVMTGALVSINGIHLINGMTPWLRLITEFVVGTGIYVLVIVFGFKTVFKEAVDFVKHSSGRTSQ